MNRSLKTRVLSMLLAVVMVIGFVPMSVYATEIDGTAPETVTVKFDTNGGVGEYEDQEVTIGDKVTKPEEDPSHETATFAYWTADLEENEEWIFEEDVVTEEVTLYASWIVAEALATNEEELEHVHAGGTATCAELAVCECGEAYGELAAHTPNEDGTVCTVCGASLIMAAEEEYYLVTFNANSGTGTMENQTISSGKLNKNTFTRSTSKFVGWNTKADGTGVAYADEAEITLTENITLYAQWDDEYYSVISEKSWDLAPGIRETQIVLNNDAGNMRQVLFVMEADINNEYVKVINSYTGMIPQYGNYQVSGMTNQVAIAEEMGYGNVVGAMNTTLSWYSGYEADRVNEPLGFIMVDAEIYFDPGNCGYTYGNVGFPSVLVINKDFDENGNPRPADIPKVEMPQIRSAADLDGWEDQVIPCSSGYILKDGVNQYSYAHGNDQAPRSVVGFKPDGTIVIMVNDGRQSPYSAGMNMYELAEAMLDLGCTYAVNCDGGGSTTWVSQRPGEEQKINNSPSDGAERSTTTGILFISTAPANGELYRAHISTESNYYTPNSEVQFHAVGTDMGGTEVEIPADTQWLLSDDSFGTIDNTGLFTSNGTEGEVTAQLLYNGEVVGEKAISIVWPTDFAFASAAMTVPFGKTVPIELVATYNGAESYVAFKVEDIDFALSETTLGTIDGFTFTANADETLEVTTGTLTATINGMSAVTAVTLGKGSEVIFDFEGENAAEDWFIYDYNVNHAGNTDNSHLDLIDVVTPETGKVHSGNSALAVNLDYSDARGNGWLQFRMGYDGECIQIENAKKLGFWIWMPEEAYANEWDLHIRCIDANGNATRLAPVLTDLGDCFMMQDEAGWRYYTADISQYPVTYFGYHDVAPTSCFYIQFYNYQQAWMADDSVVNTQGKFTYFIDDITIEYSDAADDADAPVFETLYLVDGNGTASEMNGQTISYNTIGAEVAVTDAANSNATGIDADSAKAYIDGLEVNCVYTNGRLSISNVTLADGMHTIKFVICDKMGNLNSVIRQVTVDAGNDIPTVNLVPHDETLTNLPVGSVYYVDLVASDIEQVQKITVDLDLVNTFDWELAYADVAEGFALSYSVEKYENVATITIDKTGDVQLDGSQVVASIPVRVWEPQIDYGVLTSGLLKEVYLTIQATRGILECTDGSISTFTCDPMKVASELYMNQWNADADFTGITLHTHTAEAIEDCDATCTENGYTGRTYCVVCASVVEWGTIVHATGHSYDFAGDVLKCTCGKLFSGVHTDGKEYVDGVTVSDGWVGESYFVDGEKVTGVQKVPAPNSTEEFYYDFGENGVCENKTKYSGLFFDGEVYRYAYLGVLTSGWQQIDGEWFYFSSSSMAAVSGTVMIGGVNYDFEENGKLVSGVWVNAFIGYRYYYGPGYHYWGWREIDGEWYLFDKGIRATGYNRVGQINDLHHTKWFYFDENGVSHGLANGMGIANDGTVYFFVEGETATGLREVNGEYYFFTAGGGLIRNQKYYVWETHCDLPQGTYEFDADGKLVDGIVEKEDGTYYYTLGQVGQVAGLINVDGDYYFVEYSGKCSTGKLYAWKTNCDLPCDTYEFGADGKMLNGIVERNGETYYYTNGKVGKTAGLTLVGDDYYFIEYSGKCATGKLYAWKTNCDLPVGTYEFGADGKMLNGVVEREDGVYYYINGRTNKDKSMVGMVKIGEDYYFVGYDGNCYTGKVYVWATQCDLPVGTYEFAADGKLLDGIVEKEDGTYYYTLGQVGQVAGLINVDGDYYFVEYSGKCSTGKLYAWKTNCDLPCDTYEFGTDGKILNGIVERDGETYYYTNGKVGKTAGLTLVGGDYYFVEYSGKCATGRLYAWKTNCDLPVGTYEFGADGKMLNGVVERDGKIYCYVLGGFGKVVGLTKVGDDYYFVNYDGTCATGKFYAWATNCDLPTGNYEFGDDGKALNGFVTRNGELYYFVNGQPGMVGINYIDGHYYFVEYGGKLVVNCVYEVWRGNGILAECKYTFNEKGQIVG